MLTEVKLGTDDPVDFEQTSPLPFSFVQGCCSKLEAMAAGGVTEAVTVQEMEQQILKQIPKLQLKIGETAIITLCGWHSLDIPS